MFYFKNPKTNEVHAYDNESDRASFGSKELTPMSEQEVQAHINPPKPSVTSADLHNQVTAQRWAVETGGITLPDGVRIATSTDDQNRITSVIANAEIAGLESVDFKAESGWVTLSVQELKDIAKAIALHVQACFSAERVHHESVDALAALHKGDAAELQSALGAYDVTTGWPDGVNSGGA